MQKPKKYLEWIAVGVAVLALVLAGVILLKVGGEGQEEQEYAGAFAAPGHNQFRDPTQTATTTQTSGLPVLLFNTNTTRIYGLIVNDSDTDLFIFLRSFANASTASTTVNINEGIRINANGGSYEILPENMYQGPVWATSTAGGKNILLIEK